MFGSSQQVQDRIIGDAIPLAGQLDQPQVLEELQLDHQIDQLIQSAHGGEGHNMCLSSTQAIGFPLQMVFYHRLRRHKGARLFQNPCGVFALDVSLQKWYNIHHLA